MENYKKGKGVRGFLRILSFIIFGVLAFSNPLDKYNPYNIIIGGLIGLFFGFLCRLFLIWLLKAFNGQLRKTSGKKVISFAVNRGMLFLLPFAIMALFSYYYLGWFISSGFLSAGIMTAATSASIEIGKLKEKQEIKDTIASLLVGAGFSTLWIFGTGVLAGAPGLIEGLVGFIFAQTSNLF